MASLKLKIRPLEIPTHVTVEIPGDTPVDVSISELPESTLADLLEEFSTNLLAAGAGKSA